MYRCDACSVAEAFHVVRKGGQELYFCDHHYRAHEISVNLWADSAETLDKTLAMV